MTSLSIARQSNDNQPWEQRILYISGRLSLDLAHTGPAGYEHFDRLLIPADLAHWLWLSDLALKEAHTTQADLDLAHQLRQAIWIAANDLRQDERPSPEDIATINRIASAPPLVPRFDLEKGQHTWQQPATAAAALALIARDAIDLFAHNEEKPIQQCRGDDCPLLFVDLSRSGRRRWCAMERCGNRAKVARHRKQKKKSSNKID